MPARPLDVATVDPDPYVQFARWYEDARAVMGDHADAMVLATATPDGEPTARVVLLRGFDARGFCWYTHVESRKGADLAANPRGALVWHWRELERQVRATGPVARIPEAEADADWAARAPASRLSAAVSAQSRPVVSRQALEDAVAALRARYPDGDVPRPAVWGGYRLAAEVLEVWEHREDRLHDRIRYRKVGGRWIRERLQP